jgi:hypothetical protein
LRINKSKEIGDATALAATEEEEEEAKERKEILGAKSAQSRLQPGREGLESKGRVDR